MNLASLRSRIQGRLWEVAQRDDGILSATLAGSFLEGQSLDAVSDIDLVVVVDRLDSARFDALVAAFEAALAADLAELGYRLRVNPTLGPLKFNDPQTAVLHLMLYSREAHVDHAISSPFTCFDWQRSTAHCKRSLAEVFPVFNLQPHHFISSRRSVRDYLRDFHAGVVSFRELACTAGGYREEVRTKPMTPRDRHEFAYHILRFLMHNLVKLVRRANLAPHGEALLDEYFGIFPEHQAQIGRLFCELAAKKQAADFSRPITDLDGRLQAFIEGFERQFRRAFFTDATRHVAFRHGPTALNRGAGGQRLFLGRTDPPLDAVDRADWQALAAHLAETAPRAAYASPLARCRQSLAALAEHFPLGGVQCDERLREIDYGQLEGLTVAASRTAHGGLFAAWARGEDPKFPGGECAREVIDRALAFARVRWPADGENSVTCTHNGVLRSLVGQVLGLPMRDWHRLEVPHLAPITFVSTRDHGLFVDLPAETARHMFADFATLSKAG